MTDKGEAIVAALRVKSPQRPGDLLAAAKLKFNSKYAYRDLLQKLAQSGRIVRKGNGRGAIVLLPGKSTAKEEP